MIVGNIPKRWKELSGSKKWAGLLNPLDNDLRRYLVIYGQLAQATYDSLNTEQVSKYAGSCRYDRDKLFGRVGLVIANPFEYKIVKYVYATSSVSVAPSFILNSLAKDAWCKESNWMGYVAVSTDRGKAALGRRDILVAWRGTIQLYEWYKDFDAPLTPSGPMFGNTSVHRGFLSVYTSSNPKCAYSKNSAREQVTSEIRRLIRLYINEEISITVTGHSLGGALGTLSATDIVANNINKPPAGSGKSPCQVTAILYACPRVGAYDFKIFAEKQKGLNILRITNVRDMVPTVPPGPTYVDVGQELKIDAFQSPYLKQPGNISTWHDLEHYMHLVAGFQGLDKGFDLKYLKRDLDLVNKYADSLQQALLVPAYWWVDRNRNVIQHSDGSWKLDEQPHFG